MLTILVLFVGLTLATAVIAYWSDNLGKKLGKKRVSLWGLRPRTTATFLTIASSWLIMIFTLGVMLLIFPPLRQSLLRYDEVKANENKLSLSAKDLTGKVGDLNGQLTSLRKQTQTLENQVSNASGKLAAVQGQLKQSRAAANQARQARIQAQDDATRARRSATAATARQKAAIEREKAARQNLQTVTTQLGATKAQREAAVQQLNVAQSELFKANAQVKSANARVKAAGFRVKVATSKVAQAEKDLSAVERNLQTVRTDLKNARQNEKTATTNAKNAKAQAYAAGAQVLKAGEQVIEAENKVKEAQTKVAQLETQSEDLKRANALLLLANEKIALEADTILSSDIRVPVGRTLASRSFEQDASFSEASDELRATFESTAAQVADEKTRLGKLLPGARLQLAPLPVPGAENDATQVVLTPKGIYTELAEVISRSQNPLSVRLISVRNHFAGEDTIYVRFIVLPIRPALPANFELASARFDPQQSDAVLFTALLNLADAGSQVANSNGVRPPLSPLAPDAYATGTTEQIFDTLRAVKALGGPARVRILTTEPISTADQLRVRFEVEPANAVTTAATARLSPTRLSPPR